MRAPHLVALVAALGMVLLAAPPADVSGAPRRRSPDLVLRAKVTGISPSPLPMSRQRWVIKTRVLKVLKGQFKGKRFDFRVHSPSRSNLQVGKQIVIKAFRVPGGYRVPDRRY